ncbi:Uncharacterized protein Fot_33670 [Forsythia ovata]|uniref:Uncharacterized protein n=1 Tax=Forsythia ovata TaxID=205694 RepID=A0ABD1TBW0_9LAMI
MAVGYNILAIMVVDGCGPLLFIGVYFGSFSHGFLGLPSRIVTGESEYKQLNKDKYKLVILVSASKLQARRSKKNTKSSSQDQPPPADFYFMPTPGFEQSNAAVFDNTGPAVDAPVRSRHEND